MAEAIIRIDKVDEGYLVKVFINGKFFDSKVLNERELREYGLGDRNEKEQGDVQMKLSIKNYKPYSGFYDLRKWNLPAKVFKVLWEV